ncbi:MAG: zinc-dependent metalloprotease [Duncaniella sp.]|nr:zinc-dependent metalloprotease [Duncaniella sp.]
MKFKKVLLSVVLLGGLTVLPAYVYGSADHDSQRSFLFFGKKKKASAKAADGAEASAPAKTSYEKIVTDTATVSSGMFEVIHNGDDYYFQIPRDLMGRDMLIVNKLVRVPKELNDAGVNRGINSSTQMVRFELDDKQKHVLVRQARPRPSVNPDDAIARSVSDNYIDPLIASFEVEAQNPDSTAYVIKVNDLYNGKNGTLGDVFNEINIGTPAVSSLSRIKSIKSFDNNVYALSELTTSVAEPGGRVNVTVEVGSSLVLLPEVPMQGRYSTARIGYFTESKLKYSDDQQRVGRENFITRWRLEPRPEDVDDYMAGRLVEPVKPIVFYIDRSTPRQWVPYIRQGILAWQDAFEMAGFKNAIQVRELPEGEEADEDDINYSVLTYAASKMSNAMGPSITDPRSGEIIEADIIWWHNVLDILRDWIVVQTGAVDPRVRTHKLPDEVMGDAMRFVACHEVGHSLGLRHNMIASSSIPTDSLRSERFTSMLNGTASSIMDYARFNYVAQPGDGVKVLTPNLGPYDMLAIEYGYRWYPENGPDAERPHLEQLLSNYADNPLYRYSEAQSVRDAVDPRAMSEDLGDNNIKAARYGMANLRRVVPQIIKWTSTGEQGQNYDDASMLYGSVLNQWNTFLYHALSNVGGMYVDNTIIGDGKKTYGFVEKERQRDAVKFLIDEAFTDTDWLFDADVADYTYIVQNTPVGRIEQAPSFMLTNLQSYLIWDLLNNDRMVRMLENESKNGSKAFTAVEMTDMLHNGIFKPTLQGRTPDVRERLVQKNYIDALIVAACEKQGVKDGVALRDEDSMPLLASLTSSDICGHNHAAGEQTCGSRRLNFSSTQANRVSDAISIKRGELMRVRDLLKSRKHVADKAARYHYNDMLMRINTALGLPLE